MLLPRCGYCKALHEQATGAANAHFRCVQVRSYQRDIGILSKQLSDIKAQYFAQKRAEKLASQRESAALTPLLLDKVGFMDDEAPLEIKAVRITSP